MRDFNALWEWHLSTYSGPDEVRFAWRSPHSRHTQLDNLRRTTGTAALKLGGTRKDARILLSGLDAVPTPSLEPPRRPGDAAHDPHMNDTWGPVTLFSRSYSEALTDMRYTPCDPRDATAQLVLPADLTIYDTAKAWGDESRTDPMVTAWELAQGPASNDVQIQRLLNWAKRYASKR